MLSVSRSSILSFRLGRNSPRIAAARSFAGWKIGHFPKFFKSSTVCVVRDCRAQIEFVIAYRIRRGLQLLILYSKLGEDYALWRCFQVVKRYFVRYSKAAAVSLSAAVFNFDWSKERIHDDDIAGHFRDIEMCHRLKEKGANVPPCNDPTPSDPEERCWVPFVTLDNLTIWKKQNMEEQSRTLCCYKIYGYFDDVKALSFLQAYLDLDTRKTWDQHVLKLEIVDSEPESNSDLIYWVAKWPKMFSNRDYVYKRRYVIDYRRQAIAVVSKAAKHPLFPPTKDNWRVESYWSYLVVKPYQTFQEKGLEFSLTYYDDPGSNLPGSMLIWATVHGMPTYFKRLHEETRKIESRGGSLVDYQNGDRPHEEVDPYLLFEHDDTSPETEKPVDLCDLPASENVPFPLPSPSDPSKPKILPSEVSHDEFLRSWELVKIKVKDSLDKAVEQYGITDEPFLSPPRSKDEASDSTQKPVEGLDPFFGTHIVKAFGGLNDKSTDLDSNLYGSILVLPNRNIFVDAVLELKRVACKFLFNGVTR
ncbi:START domain [Nesidiocoris tenuis]|uniref:START domain n=1 Tax=Nesidiocoris tenuis TaxID=355587 RepID=A0ABN7B9F7_9HEMI|nr:START domain [Nesidiocoris tenuis]